MECKGKTIGQPIYGCGCDYCRPKLTEHFKKRRKETAEIRRMRFDFVRRVVAEDIVVDDNDMKNSMTSLWADMYGDDSKLMFNENIIRLPLLLKRLNRYLPFDLSRMSKETQDRVKDIWNSIK